MLRSAHRWFAVSANSIPAFPILSSADDSAVPQSQDDLKGTSARSSPDSLSSRHPQLQESANSEP
jgi:hypothetical protein